MINVAIDAAKQAGELALRYFKSQPKVSYKSDNSPVTRADIEAEKLIRRIISRKFPNHGIIGEELPPVNPKAKYQWVIDPIDGTRDFIRGIPYWAILIGLLEDNKPIIGISYFPQLEDLLAAQKDKGAFWNGKKLKVSKTKLIENAYVSVGTMKRLQQQNRMEIIKKIAKNTSTVRSYANLGYLLMLEGKIDIILEPYAGVWDLAALAVIVEEAGGKFSDFSGNHSLTSFNGVFTNGLLHSQVLKLLNTK